MRHLIALAACLLYASPCLLCAAEHEHEESPMEQAMGELNGSLRSLKRATSKGELPPDAAELIATAKAALLVAREQVPTVVTEAPEADRAALLADFQGRIDAVTAKLTELEEAVTAQDADRAAVLVGELYDLKKSGHEHFVKEDE